MEREYRTGTSIRLRRFPQVHAGLFRRAEENALRVFPPFLCGKSRIQQFLLLPERNSRAIQPYAQVHRENFEGHGLRAPAKEYFEALVQYNQAEQVDIREQAWKQILQIRKQIEFTHVTTREQAYFSKWYYPIIRELAVDLDWHEDYRVLARSLTPQITTEEARKAVKNLLEWGLLKKEGDRYELTSQMLDAAEIPPIALRQIRHEYIQHAIGAVESMPKDERFATFTTLAMSKSSYDYAVEILEDARKKIIARASNDTNVERIYEMMLVAFPMSKMLTKEDEG